MYCSLFFFVAFSFVERFLVLLKLLDQCAGFDRIRVASGLIHKYLKDAHTSSIKPHILVA
jgi:hypothetical protein